MITNFRIVQMAYIKSFINGSHCSLANFANGAVFGLVRFSVFRSLVFLCFFFLFLLLFSRSSRHQGAEIGQSARASQRIHALHQDSGLAFRFQMPMQQWGRSVARLWVAAGQRRCVFASGLICDFGILVYVASCLNLSWLSILWVAQFMRTLRVAQVVTWTRRVEHGTLVHAAWSWSYATCVCAFVRVWGLRNCQVRVAPIALDSSGSCNLFTGCEAEQLTTPNVASKCILITLYYIIKLKQHTHNCLKDYL